MPFDPFLYVALGLGLLAGRWIRAPEPATGRVTLAAVVALVALLGASLARVPAASLAAALPLAAGYVVLILVLTAGICFLLARRPGRVRDPPAPSTAQRFPWTPLGLLVALGIGYGIGRGTTFPAARGLEWALYVLLALVGFGLRLNSRAVRRAWVPIASASVGAVGAALLWSAVVGTSLPVALATALSFGWYSLAGPLVLAQAGPALGLLAFLTNYLREDLTMLLAPVLGSRLRSEGLAAFGGATSMDTTLFFVTRYGDPEAGSLALASGLVLTAGASLLLPLVLLL